MSATEIKPQEFQILNDKYVIRTRCPKEHVTDAMIIMRARNANLVAGDAITVQCFDHAFEQLLHEAEFRVITRRDTIERTAVTDRDIRQVNKTDVAVQIVGSWWSSDNVESADPPSMTDPAAVTPDDLQVAWNPGKKMHQVKSGEEVIYETKDKDEANAVASGQVPVSDVA